MSNPFEASASDFPFGNTSPVQTRNPKPKADRFLNFDVPTGDGGTVKLAYAALSSSDPNHKQLIEWLDKDPDKNVQILQQNMAMSYRDAVKKEREFTFMASVS